MKKHLTQAAAIAAIALAVSPAWAINKCTQPDGSVVFQDAPCAGGKGEAIVVRPASGNAQAGSAESTARVKQQIARIESDSQVTAAIELGEPLVGMTRAELDRAMGPPTKVNANNYGGRLNDQIIYERRDQSWYVYTDNDVVTSIQHRPAAINRVKVRCPGPMEIRSMETSASSIRLSDGERIQRRKEIAEARKCGQL